jgi:hypothetical protein
VLAPPWVATFGGYADADNNGHGTATASIAVGNGLETAPGSNAIAVKMISDAGEAYTYHRRPSMDH